jgi:excisionase family DNA binding protein
MSADATKSRRPQSDQPTRVHASMQNEAAARFRPSRPADATRQHAVRAANGEAHQQPATADDILTVNEVAELLKLSPRTVGEYGARGVLPSVKIGRHRRFSRRQLEALMAVGREPAGS